MSTATRKSYLEIMQEGGKQEWEKTRKHTDKAVFLLASDKKVQEKSKSVIKDLLIAGGIQVASSALGLSGVADTVCDIITVGLLSKAAVGTYAVKQEMDKSTVTQEEIDDFFIM